MANKKNRRPEKSAVEPAKMVNACSEMRRLLEKAERNEEEQSSLRTLIERWWTRESPLLETERVVDSLDTPKKKEAYVFVLDAWQCSLEATGQAAEKISISKEGEVGFAPDVMDRLEEKRQRLSIHSQLGGKPVMDRLDALCPSYDQGIKNVNAACLKAARKKERKYPFAAIGAALSALFTAVRCSISFIYKPVDSKKESGAWCAMFFNRKSKKTAWQEKEVSATCDQ